MSYLLAQVQEAAASPEQNPWLALAALVTTVLVTAITHGLLTRRAVNKHGDQEMGKVDELKNEVVELKRSTDHSNTLQEQTNSFNERRLVLVEDRVDRLERTVYKVA